MSSKKDFSSILNKFKEIDKTQKERRQLGPSPRSQGPSSSRSRTSARGPNPGVKKGGVNGPRPKRAPPARKVDEEEQNEDSAPSTARSEDTTPLTSPKASSEDSEPVEPIDTTPRIVAPTEKPKHKKHKKQKKKPAPSPSPSPREQPKSSREPSTSPRLVKEKTPRSSPSPSPRAPSSAREETKKAPKGAGKSKTEQNGSSKTEKPKEEPEPEPTVEDKEKLKNVMSSFYWNYASAVPNSPGRPL